MSSVIDSDRVFLDLLLLDNDSSSAVQYANLVAHEMLVVGHLCFLLRGS